MVTMRRLVKGDKAAHGDIVRGASVLHNPINEVPIAGMYRVVPEPGWRIMLPSEFVRAGDRILCFNDMPNSSGKGWWYTPAWVRHIGKQVATAGHVQRRCAVVPGTHENTVDLPDERELAGPGHVLRDGDYILSESGEWHLVWDDVLSIECSLPVATPFENDTTVYETNGTSYGSGVDFYHVNRDDGILDNILSASNDEPPGIARDQEQEHVGRVGRMIDALGENPNYSARMLDDGSWCLYVGHELIHDQLILREVEESALEMLAGYGIVTVITPGYGIDYWGVQ